MVGERTEEGFSALTLESEAPGGVEAIFVPEAGMICCSLRHRGQELLGQRGGLTEYVGAGSAVGVPFLHPGGNRPGGRRLGLAGGGGGPGPGGPPGQRGGGGLAEA